MEVSCLQTALPTVNRLGGPYSWSGRFGVKLRTSAEYRTTARPARSEPLYGLRYLVSWTCSVKPQGILGLVSALLSVCAMHGVWVLLGTQVFIRGAKHHRVDVHHERFARADAHVLK